MGVDLNHISSRRCQVTDSQWLMFVFCYTCRNQARPGWFLQVYWRTASSRFLNSFQLRQHSLIHPVVSVMTSASTSGFHDQQRKVLMPKLKRVSKLVLQNKILCWHFLDHAVTKLDPKPNLHERGTENQRNREQRRSSLCKWYRFTVSNRGSDWLHGIFFGPGLLRYWGRERFVLMSSVSSPAANITGLILSSTALYKILNREMFAYQ